MLMVTDKTWEAREGGLCDTTALTPNGGIPKYPEMIFEGGNWSLGREEAPCYKTGWKSSWRLMAHFICLPTLKIHGSKAHACGGLKGEASQTFTQWKRKETTA